jgi:hypothetical protein
MKSAFRNVFALVIFTSTPALAAELPKEGNYDQHSCWAGVSNLISFSKEHTASSFEMTGTIRSNPPGGMFDKNSFRCVGTNSSMGGKNTGITVCEAIDTDGDKRLTYYSNVDGKLTREVVSGTGKYDGMVTSSNSVESHGPFPTIKAGTFQDCNRQTGTYKLK